MDVLPVDGTATRINVDLAQLKHTLALPEVAAGPEEKHNGHRQHGVEETLNIGVPAAHGADGNEELHGKDENTQEETKPGTVNAEGRSEGDFVEGVALGFPCGAEADVRLVRY
jgi:hypothetical protein